MGQGSGERNAMIPRRKDTGLHCLNWSELDDLNYLTYDEKIHPCDEMYPCGRVANVNHRSESMPSA